jgi:hypothetical protein
MDISRRDADDEIELNRPGFIIVEPDAPWIECLILSVSANGLFLDVGAIAVPKIFAVAFTPCGWRVLDRRQGGSAQTVTR